MRTQLLSPVMVGRDRDLAHAEEALLSSLRDDSRLLVLCGEAGVGKSRLATTLEARARSFRATVLHGECSQADVALPYLPFVEALGNWLQASGIDVASLTAELGPATAALSRLLPQLGRADIAFSTTDTSLDKLRLFEALVALLRTIARDHGLLLVVEDVHWADHSTRELLDYVVRRLQGMRTMLLVTVRANEVDRHHPLQAVLQRWRRAGLSDTLTLQPLDEAAVAAMVAAILDTESPPPDLTRQVCERSEGIPFAVEELLRDAVTGDASSVAGMTRAPRSLSDSILVQAEQLGEAHLELLRCAAVLGRSFAFDVLTAMTQRPVTDVMDALDVWLTQSLVVPEPQADATFRFRHGLIREALYDSMIVPRRRLLHGQAADVLRTRPETHAADLAEHLIASARFAEASPVCAQAAEDALLRLAPHEACQLFETAANYCQDRHEHARLLCRLGEAWHQAGDAAVAQRWLEEGIAGLEAEGDLITAARHRLSLGRYCWERSRNKDAHDHFERARSVLEPLGDSEDLARAYVRLASLRSYDVDAGGARDHAQRALDIAERIGADQVRIDARNWLGLALCASGALDEGVATILASAEDARGQGLSTLEGRIVGHALSMLESHGRARDAAPLLVRLQGFSADPSTVVVAPYYEGWLHFWNADLHAAADAAQRCIECARGFAMNAQEEWGRALLCVVRTEQDDLESARIGLPAPDPDAERQVVLEQGWVRLRWHLAAGDVAGALSLAAALAAMPAALAGTPLADTVTEVLIEAGNTSAAASLVEAMVASPRARMHRGHLARAQARVALAAGRLDEAAALAAEATAILDASGYRLEALRTSVVAGQISLAQAHLHQAEETLRRALLAARASGARVIARQASAIAERHSLDLGGGADETNSLIATGSRETTAPADPPAPPTGERLVSVLFADVRGYTAMTRAHAPAEMADRIAAFQRWALLAVERHRGVIDKFAGDAVMATFNVSGMHTDHARHAAEVAADLVRNAAMVGLSVGAGVATGPAIVGRLAGSGNMTVLGETTNLAARLQAQAAGGEVLLSADAFRRLGSWLPDGAQLVGERQLELKGFDTPVTAFTVRVTAATKAPT